MSQINEERTMLTQTVKDLVAKHAGPEAVRAAMDSERGFDEALWTMLCEQVGVAALVVPEELGGAGGELADAAAVMTELGRGLVPTPLLGTTLAELALLAAETPDADILEQLAAGAVIGTVVFDPDYVLNGDTAEVVVAAVDGELQRWNSFDAEPLTSMDPTRRLAKLHATDTAALGTDPGLADTALLLLAAEQIGAATCALELTVAYTKERVQFGRPIGSFQALKHRMADLYVKVQTAGAVVDEAVQNWATDPSSANAALAHVMATEAFRDVVGEAVQMHGGIAITAEHDIQLYFKRAHGSSHLFVTAAEALKRLEAEIFSGAAART
jgi:alkylation response protein AidB-like acyl-CoA dehydrogenase